MTVGTVGVGASSASAATPSRLGALRLLRPDPRIYCARTFLGVFGKARPAGIDAPVSAHHDTTRCRDVLKGFGSMYRYRAIDWDSACSMTHPLSEAWTVGGWWFCSAPVVLAEFGPTWKTGPSNAT
jgi:hypothetical protein